VLLLGSRARHAAAELRRPTPETLQLSLAFYLAGWGLLAFGFEPLTKESEMQFKQGAGVRMSDGKAIGQLDRVVVDPRTREVNYIVVRKGAFFTTDRIVPLSLIARADDDGVLLREDARDLEQLPLFEERHYVPADQAGSPGAAASSAGAGFAAAPTLYPYPPVVGGELRGLGNVDAQTTLGAATFQQPIVEETQRSIPDDNVAIRSGARVISADGKQVGVVEQVLTGEYADQVTHFVISQGLLFKDRKLVPLGWVSQIGEEEVHLAVDAGFLGNLQGYDPRR
jgi:uncharacterized protein YrrD